MKMNKILAAGVAASLAVTSLAAVASAADRTFEMKYTVGKYTYSPSANKNPSEQLDAAIFGMNHYTALDATTGFGGVANVDKFNTDGQTGAGNVSYKDFDAYIPVVVDTNADFLLKKTHGLKVVIKGYKKNGVTGNFTPITETATLVPYTDDTDTDINYVLPLYYGSAPEGYFMPCDFDAIDTVSIVLGDVENVDLDGLNEAQYTKLEEFKSKNTPDTLQVTAGADGLIATTADNGAEILGNGAANGYVTMKVKAVSDAAYLVGADVADGEITRGANIAGVALYDEITKLIGTDGITINWKSKEGSTYDKEAWLPKTDGIRGQKEDTILNRFEIVELSTTRDYESSTTATKGFIQVVDGYNQSFTETDYNKGTQPQGFAGLASQVADFFNKQLNGTITFHFAAGKTSEGGGWLNGGVPSTEVGLKNAITGATANDFALFVNYGSTTGSLQAVTEVKAEELSVSFDISEILDALNGQTIGTVQDIYYGMVKGVTYDEGIGFKVDKVVLAYDEDADDGDIVDGDEDEGDVDVDTDEDEGDVDTDEDEGDVDVDTDEDEGDGEVDGDTDEDLPTDEDEAGEDENPGTGVALAVVPAIMAAAAVVVSKKRK